MVKFVVTNRLALLACLCASQISLAQENQPPAANVQIFGIGTANGEVSEEMRAKMASGAATVLSSQGGAISFSSGGFGGVDPNNRSHLFNLLSNESVRKELALTENQYSGARKIMQESQRRTSQMITDMIAAQRNQGGGNQGPGTALRLGGEEIKQLREETQAQAEAAIEEILLPEQMKRIRQLAYQIEVTQQGLGEALVNGRLGTEIEVHEGQKQHLTDRAADIEAQARLAIAKIRAAARAEMLSELTPDQRKAATERLGDYFDYEELSLAQQLRQQVKSMQSPAVEKGKNEKDKKQ